MSFINTPQIERPLLIYDGECKFCCRWIEHWKAKTEDSVEYATSKDVGSKFPELTKTDFEKSVILIHPDGKVYKGAQAVFEALALRKGSWGISRKLYQSLPGFKWLSEHAYACVSKNRHIFSILTSLLWGKDLSTPRYEFATWLMMKSFALVALAAFLSFWVQAEGLIGSLGILPMQNVFGMLKANQASFFNVPSVFIWDSSDTAMHMVTGLGCLACITLFIGYMPAVSAFVIWICYLSITIAGQVFFAFQWDALLIEMSLLMIFLAPWVLKIAPKVKFSPNRLAHFLFCWLLFRLMFESGIVKLVSFDRLGENTWLNFTALNFHYFTQPLPAWTSWYLDKLPIFLQKCSLLFMYFAELICPLLMWGPRRLRKVAFYGMVLLQIGILISGNYGFFNLLTLVLCFSLIDDQSLPKFIKWRWELRNSVNYTPNRILSISKKSFLTLLATMTIIVGGYQVIKSFEVNNPLKPRLEPFLPLNQWQANAYVRIAQYRAVNSYGLFRVMTQKRPELVIEGSNDNLNWKPYIFKYKPGPLDRRPVFTTPHMPRLDWQMWFAALLMEQNQSIQVWLSSFIQKLFTGNPAVNALIEENPFPGSVPTFFRVRFYYYNFSSGITKSETGEWWMREPADIFTIQGTVNSDSGAVDTAAAGRF